MPESRLPVDVSGRPLRLRDVDLDTFLHPTTVAVIGASEASRKPNAAMTLRIKQWADEHGASFFPVHPVYETVLGARCYATIDDVPGDMKARTLYYRRIARFNPQHFDTSLRAMGTAAYYGTVPWSAVTRYATLEFDHMHPQWYMRCVDSVPSILSYRVLGHNHEAFTKWIFGDEVSADELFMMSIDRSPETTAALMNDRRGITVRVNECS